MHFFHYKYSFKKNKRFAVDDQQSLLSLPNRLLITNLQKDMYHFHIWMLFPQKYCCFFHEYNIHVSQVSTPAKHEYDIQGKTSVFSLLWTTNIENWFCVSHDDVTGEFS